MFLYVYRRTTNDNDDDDDDDVRVYACRGIPGAECIYEPLRIVLVYLRKCYFEKIANEMFGLS